MLDALTADEIWELGEKIGSAAGRADERAWDTCDRAAVALANELFDLVGDVEESLSVIYNRD